MKEYKIGKYSGLIISEIDNKPDINHMLKINKENEELKKENKKLEKKIENLITLNEEMKIEIMKLRGKCIELELKNKLNMPIPKNNNY